MLVVKKYANRRLYDTSSSKYITLEDLADGIRRGKDDVIVQDAHSGADITQATLTQIILESRGGAKLLPVPLLLRLIRMEDESLGEFFGRYVSWALETYLQAKQGARSLLPLNPLATAPFAATDALARLVLGQSPWRSQPSRAHARAAPPPAPQPPAPPPAQPSSPGPPEDMPDDFIPTGRQVAEAIDEETGAVARHVAADMARLRAEIEALKRSMAGGARARRSRASGAKKKRR